MREKYGIPFVLKCGLKSHKHQKVRITKRGRSEWPTVQTRLGCAISPSLAEVYLGRKLHVEDLILHAMRLGRFGSEHLVGGRASVCTSNQQRRSALYPSRGRIAGDGGISKGSTGGVLYVGESK